MLAAFKRDFSEPIQWVHLHDNRAVFHRVITQQMPVVETQDGQMIRVQFRKVDLADPDMDIAALVGKADVRRKSGARDPHAPELWYWNDKFWMKAVESDSIDYYKRKSYLIYEVEVENPELLLSSLTHAWQNQN